MQDPWADSYPMTEISSFAASKTAQYANRPSSSRGRPVGSDEENDENKEEVINRYKKQLDLYAEVVENLTGKEVKEKCIYLWSDNS